MPQEDDEAAELDHGKEILWVVFPADNGATKIVQPSKQSFDFPTAAVATQATTVLRCGRDAHRFVRRGDLHTVAVLDALVQPIAVIRAVADHSVGRFGEGRQSRYNRG